jgi:hypothetical protein
MWCGKGKVHPKTGHEGQIGSNGRALLFLEPWTVDESGWSMPCTICFLPGKETQFPLYRRLGASQRLVWMGVEKSYPHWHLIPKSCSQWGVTILIELQMMGASQKFKCVCLLVDMYSKVLCLLVDMYSKVLFITSYELIIINPFFVLLLFLQERK